MALNSSGAISLGGSTTGQSINLELNKSATAQISLNDSDARTLASVPSGQISLSTFYGKSYQTGDALYAWGINWYGGLGNTTLGGAYATDGGQSILTVGGLWDTVSGANSLAAPYGNVSFGIKTNGTLWSWGNNGYNQLGRTPYYSNNTNSPVQVGSATNWKSVRSGPSGEGAREAQAVKTDGTAWTWGPVNDFSGYYNLMYWYYVPCDGTLVTNLSTSGSKNTSTVQTACDANFFGPGYTGAIQNATTCDCYENFGDNNYLGTVDRYKSYPASANTEGIDFKVPVQNTNVGTGWSWIQPTRVASVLGLKTDGTLWMWGYTGPGSSTVGSAIQIYNYSSPVQIGAGSGLTWNKVETNAVTVGIKSNGTLWSWCYSCTVSTLGRATLPAANVPAQIGVGTNWAEVSVGLNHVLAVKTDGTLWAWGVNTQYQLGTSNNTTYSSPVQIGSATNWSKVKATAINSYALKTDGTLWAWGGGTNAVGLNVYSLGYSTTLGGFCYGNESGLLGNSTFLQTVNDLPAYDCAGVCENEGFSYVGQSGSTCFCYNPNTDTETSRQANLTNSGSGNCYDVYRNYSSPVQIGSLTGYKKLVEGPAYYHAFATR